MMASFKWRGRNLTVLRSEYQYGSCKQPALLTFDDSNPMCSVASGIPYGILTVNLDDPACEPIDGAEMLMQFIDVNDWPGIEEILADVDWIEATDYKVRSGFVEYPLYIFGTDIEHV